MRSRYRNFGSSVEDFALSPSGKRIALAARGDLFSAPAKNGVTRRLTSDTSSRETSPSWSPDGQEIAFMSDESGEQQIYVKPQMGGEAELIPTPRGEVISSVQWSPKGTYLAFTTIDNGFGFVNRKTGDSRIVHKDKLGNLPFDFSHDESWIVYSAVQDNLFASVMLYNVEDKTHHQVTSGLYNSQSASFDLNGKYLYFSSDRSYAPNFDAFAGASLHQTNTTRIYMTTLRTDLMNPLDKPEDEEPVKKAEAEEKPAGDAPAAEKPKGLQIDIEGLEQRAQALPWPPGQYPFVIGANNGVFTWSAGSLVKFDAASGAPMTIMPGVSSLDFNPTRTKMAYRSGNTIGITDVRPGLKPGAGAVNTSNVGYMWNPQDEYKQMFWEAWRYERDHFYDKDMLGLDWKAIGDKYAAMLPYVGDRSDLNYIFGMLVGELGTGHAYVMGGDVAQGATPEAPTAAGMLGVDYAVENGKVRLAKIYRGFNTDASAKGPLGAPGVDARQGDYLMAIDGHPVDASVNVDSLLIGKVGQIVELSLNSDPVDIGSRIVKVRPIGNESSLRYATWQDERRNLVDEWSNGQIGYMHVPDTSVPGIINFVRGFYSQSGKKAWVIDERDNGGGSIPTFFIEALARQFDTAFKQRHGVDVGFPTQSLDGPKVMLINQNAGSGGDMFPWLFRNSELGPLMGTRTWGGLVGISGRLGLVDGGGVTAPSFGIYDTATSKWIAENTGVDPDIEVDNDPAVLASGHDLQLKTAVDYLLKELASGKAWKGYKSPDFPRIKRGG
jgi:tricorn protease